MASSIAGEDLLRPEPRRWRPQLPPPLRGRIEVGGVRVVLQCIHNSFFYFSQIFPYFSGPDLIHSPHPNLPPQGGKGLLLLVLMSSSDTSSKGRGDLLDSISSIFMLCGCSALNDSWVENRITVREGINSSPTENSFIQDTYRCWERLYARPP